MSTRSDLRQLVRIMVGDEQSVRFTDATLNSFLEFGIRRLSNVMKNTSVTTTVAVTDGVGTIPTNFLAMERVSYEGNPLFSIDRREIKHLVRPATGTVPSFYWLGNEEINVWPPATCTLSVEYIRTTIGYTESVSETTNIKLGARADEFLMHYVCWMLYLSIQDSETAQTHSVAMSTVENQILHTLNTPDADEPAGIGVAAYGDYVAGRNEWGS